jgi:hypothetical protein
VCSKERKDSNEVDCIMALGEMEILLCDNCAARVESIIVDWIRNYKL